jgi:hypothetical protein
MSNSPTIDAIHSGSMTTGLNHHRQKRFSFSYLQANQSGALENEELGTPDAIVVVEPGFQKTFGEKRNNA